MVDTFGRLRIVTKGVCEIPRPGGQSLGVHGFGTKQPKVLVSMDLEPSSQKSWCPWIWHRAARSLGVHGFGIKQSEDLVSMDLEPSTFPCNVIELAEL